MHFVTFFFSHWLFHPLHGNGYQFYSGVAGLVSCGWLVAYLRKHNCHAHHCWRLARHPVPNTPYVTCLKHHPNTPNQRKHVTTSHIHNMYNSRHGGKVGYSSQHH